MELTVNQILKSIAGLRSFGQGVKIPMGISMKLAKNQRELDFVGEQYNKNRETLIKEYGRTNEVSGQVTIPVDNADEFNSSVNSLLTDTVDVNLQAIKLADLPEDFTVEHQALVPLDWMIDDD